MDEDRSREAFNMETQRKTYYSTDRRGQYKGRAFQADLLKLTLAVIAELLIFLLWFDGPSRERYEILVHIALPICIVLPIINYRYLIVVPFIAFLPDLARAFDFDISHSLVVLPLVFATACVPFIRRPKTALIAAYAVTAIWASHLIVDARKYTTIGNVAGYPWSDLVLYTLILTLLGFLLMQVLRFSNHFERNGYGPRDIGFRNQTPLRSESASVLRRADDNDYSAISRRRRSRRIEVTMPIRAAESRVTKAKDPSSPPDQKLQFESDSFVVGDVTSKKALMSKIREKKGV